VTDISEFLTPGPSRNDKHPDGWKPRLEVDTTDGGYIVSRPFQPDTPPDHATILDDFGLDPAQWTVTSVRRSRWQRYDGEWLEAARLTVVPAGAARTSAADLDRLCTDIARWRPRTAVKSAQDGTFVVPVGDTQFGKPDGDGTPGTVRRLLTETEAAAARLKSETRRGQAPAVTLAWLGDCIEGIWSQGGALRMRLDITPTEQVRVYRRLMWAQVKTFAHLASTLTVPVVPGNHDDAVRLGGGNAPATRYDESWAIEGASAVWDAVQENDELGHVRFVFPARDELTVTLDMSGTLVGMAHGHQFGRDPLGWWDGQAGGRTDIGSADVLLAAHLHHLRVQDHGGGRLFLQIPALDGGSSWFRHRRGQAAPSRLVSFWTGGGDVWGLDPLRVAA
jgi:hypothetical protein